ncbi:MAG: LPXTG cell wall anchor domain-containing protein [Actinocatenispora sp.]
MHKRYGRLTAGLGVLAGTGVGLAVLAAPAAADPGTDHVLHASASTPDAVSPGGTGTFRYSVQNTGGSTTAGVLMNVALPHYVTLPQVEQDKQCQRTEVTAEHTLYSCAITDQNGKLTPGQVATNTVSFGVAKNAPGPQDIGSIAVLVVPLDTGGQPTESWQDLKGPNTVGAAVTTTKNSYDYAVTAPRATGKVGDTVTITATGANSGPSDVVGGQVDIVAPSGTELASLPAHCTWVAKPSTAHCDGTGMVVGSGKSASVDVELTITDAKVGDDGRIAVTLTTPGDTDSDNNAAPLSVETTGGSGGGDGGDGGDGDTLPVTGSSTATIAGTGAAVLLLGGVLFLVGRRRYRSRHSVR